MGGVFFGVIIRFGVVVEIFNFEFVFEIVEIIFVLDGIEVEILIEELRIWIEFWYVLIFLDIVNVDCFVRGIFCDVLGFNLCLGRVIVVELIFFFRCKEFGSFVCFVGRLRLIVFGFMLLIS